MGNVNVIFGSGVSQEPYKTLGCARAHPKFLNLEKVSKTTAIAITEASWRQVAVQYKQLMTCTQSLQFCSAQSMPIFQKKIRTCLLSKPLLMPGSSVQVHGIMGKSSSSAVQLGRKDNPWMGVAGAFVEHQHLFRYQLDQNLLLCEIAFSLFQKVCFTFATLALKGVI